MESNIKKIKKCKKKLIFTIFRNGFKLCKITKIKDRQINEKIKMYLVVKKK